jgi:hypothetical protein
MWPVAPRPPAGWGGERARGGLRGGGGLRARADLLVRGDLDPDRVLRHRPRPPGGGYAA